MAFPTAMIAMEQVTESVSFQCGHSMACDNFVKTLFAEVAAGKFITVNGLALHRIAPIPAAETSLSAVQLPVAPDVGNQAFF